jgi:hypothetical protein
MLVEHHFPKMPYPEFATIAGSMELLREDEIQLKNSVDKLQLRARELFQEFPVFFEICQIEMILLLFLCCTWRLVSCRLMWQASSVVMEFSQLF